MMRWEDLPPKETKWGSLCPPPKFSMALANAMSPLYDSRRPSLKSVTRNKND